MNRPSMRSSASSKQLGVFDFTEDEIEKESKKLLRRFGSPRSESSTAIDKYEFLRYFAQDTAIEKKKPHSRVIDIEGEDWIKEKGQPSKSSDASAFVSDQQCPKLQSNRMNMSSDEGAHKAGICGLASHLQSALLGTEKHRINNTISYDRYEKCGKVLDKERTECDSNGYVNSDPIDVNSDDNHGRKEIDSSTSTSSCKDEVSVSPGEEESDCSSGAREINTESSQVRVIPDVMIYGDIYCTHSKLTFSHSYVEVEGSAINSTERTFRCQWPVGDIIKIESEWYLEVETAIVNLLIKSRSPKGSADVNETIGIDLLKFAVYDPNWSVAIEAIKSLDLRYKNMWFDISAIDGENEENAFKGQISQNSVTNPAESFEDIIYPLGDQDAVLISKKDIEFLRPESFINDTIIDFYIRYLKDHIQPEEQCRFHFFNCFFFRKLANIDRGSHSTTGGREAFERVKKWTRKVDLFGKDYIFIPVNFSLHWSLIIICHPSEAVHYNGDEAQNSQRVPCILHMDSIKGSHRVLKSIFPSYLAEEWKERHGDITNVSSRILDLQFIPLEVPQQQNSYDCGLFLLHYLELFIQQAPVNFNPSIISKLAGFLSRNWFPPAEASLKREYIRELLFSLQKGHSQNSGNCGSTKPSSGVSKTESIKETCSLINPFDASSTIAISVPLETDTVKEARCLRKSSDASSAIAISVPQAETLASAARRAHVARCRKTSEELSESLGKETFYKSGYDPKVSKCRKVFMSPIKEVHEIGESTTNSPLERYNSTSAKMVEEANTSGTTLFSGDDCQWVETSRNKDCALYIEDSDVEETVSIPSIPESPYSSEAQPSEDDTLLILEESEGDDRTSDLQSPSTSVEMLSDFVVEDSLELNDNGKDGDTIKDSASSFSTLALWSEEREISVHLDLKEKGSVLGRSRDLVSQPLDKHIRKKKKC